MIVEWNRLYLKDEKYSPKNDGIFISHVLMEPKIIKSRYPFPCLVCGNVRESGTRYLGDSKICQLCLNEWIRITIIKFKQLIKNLNNLEKYIDKNKTLWGKEILINSLKPQTIE